MYFVDISTSKNGVNVWYFEHVDFQIYFVLQRRVFFRYLNFQKSSDTEVFYTFWVGNVIRAITAYIFSTS